MTLPGYNGSAPELAVVMLRLLREARNGNAARENITQLLPDLLRQRARQLDCADADGALHADPNNPGYLIRDVDGYRLYVPFPIASAFPRTKTLREVIPLALGVTVSDTSSVCISGSTTFLGALQEIADLDICEYIFDATVLIDSFARHVGRTGLVSLAAVKCDKKLFTFPFDGCADHLARLVADGAPKGNTTRPLKLDFCARRPGDDLLPATNLVLWLREEEPELGNGFASFSHQEAVILREPAGARTLVDAGRLGAYMAFLHLQVCDLGDENPLKALKRALSLCYILGLADWPAALVGILNTPAARAAVRSKRIKELEMLIERCEVARRDELSAMLDRQRSNLARVAFGDTERRQVDDEARRAVQAFLAHIDDLDRYLERVDGQG